jgi:hypothetical protein
MLPCIREPYPDVSAKTVTFASHSIYNPVSVALRVCVCVSARPFHVLPSSPLLKFHAGFCLCCLHLPRAKVCLVRNHGCPSRPRLLVLHPLTDGTTVAHISLSNMSIDPSSKFFRVFNLFFCLLVATVGQGIAFEPM